MGNFDYTKGVSAMNRGREARALMGKWNRTGLLKGLKGVHSANMARLLENQAAQLLKEAASSTGTVTAGTDGWQNVAFPLVRRVFAQLLANDLVSVQPMSLPSGLIFYMDYKFGTENPSGTAKLQDYTGNIMGGTSSLAGGGFNTGTGKGGGGFSPPFELGSAYTQYTSSAVVRSARASSGTGATGSLLTRDIGTSKLNYRDDSFLSNNSGDTYYITKLKTIDVPIANLPADADLSAYKHFIIHAASGSVNGRIGLAHGTATTASLLAGSAKTIRAFTSMPNSTTLRFVVSGSGADSSEGNTPGGADPDGQIFDLGMEYVIRDTFTNQKVDSVFESNLDSLESGQSIEPVIPEINLSIETTAVTAQPRKLKARWTPELAQDLNAYHDLDAEVELTTILGEEIAQEIDNEILLDLLNAAEGAYMEPGGNSPFSSRALPQTKGAKNVAHWSRVVGRYIDENGNDASASGVMKSSSFGYGLATSQREWYETLVEKVIHVSNQIHKKTLRAKANFLVTSPEVGTILESTLAFRPVMSLDVNETSFGLGVENIGTVNNRFQVYVSPYFPRNRVLVGYKGDSFLETGYVYAPYVPLIVTPTIFAPEDFTPRKGVMTRYAKKVVRPEFYGSVICHDLGQF